MRLANLLERGQQSLLTLCMTHLLNAQVLLEQLSSTDSSVGATCRLHIMCSCDSGTATAVHLQARHQSGSGVPGALRMEVMLGDLAFDLHDCRQDVILMYQLQTMKAEVVD